MRRNTNPHDIRSWLFLVILVQLFLWLFPGSYNKNNSATILFVDCFSSSTNKMEKEIMSSSSSRSIEEKLSPLVLEMKEEWKLNAFVILENAIGTKKKKEEKTTAADDVDLIILVKEYLLEMMNQLPSSPSSSSSGKRRNKKNEYRDLQRHAKKLLTTTNSSSTDTTVFTIGLLLGALSLYPSEYNASSKAMASAIVAITPSTSLSNENDDESGSIVSLIQIFLYHYIHNSKDVNLSILVYLVQAMTIQTTTTIQHQKQQLSTLSAQTLLVATSKNEDEKEDWMAALKLACFLPPCSNMISLKECIQLAITPYKLWHVAEKLCHQYPSSNHNNNNRKSIEEAVEFLIQSAWNQNQYRMADQMSTALHKVNNNNDDDHPRASIELVAKARYYHARSTIFNMIQKRQYPLIERQVDRVDHIVSKIKNNNPNDYCQDIRTYTLEQLKQVGEIESFVRYANLWEQPIPYTQEEYRQMYKVAQEKKQSTYLQWNDIFFDQQPLPQLISNASDLLTIQDFFAGGGQQQYGFDAEWDDDCHRGVSILQIATIHQVILLDMIALTSTKEGMDALQQTVGTLFVSTTVTIVGFSCQQDLQKLRQQLPTIPTHNHNILDLKVLVSKEEPTLKDLGLSKVCHHYLGKPLDKSEQCSNWSSNRPLSIPQRVYAALDAYVCVAIYQKLQQPKQPSLSNKKHKK